MNSKKGKKGLEKIKQRAELKPFEKKLLNKVDKATKIVLKEDKFEETEPKPRCTTCFGWGWWPVGDLIPIGEWDSRDWGSRTIQCPWCKNPYNGQTTGERYESLVTYKKEHETKR